MASHSSFPSSVAWRSGVVHLGQAAVEPPHERPILRRQLVVILLLFAASSTVLEALSKTSERRYPVLDTDLDPFDEFTLRHFPGPVGESLAPHRA